MSYGLRYRLEFDSTDDKHYVLWLSKKDYSGLFENLTASSVPIVQEWLTDNPKEPVRGSSLSIKYVNINNICPLVNFLSEEDDTWQVYYFYESGANRYPLFNGYLVQDDCREPMLDTSNEVTLTATDNLGLLKDITIEEAAANLGIASEYDFNIQHYSDKAINVVASSIAFPVAVGDQLTISGTDSTLDGVYTISSIDIFAPLLLNIEFTTTHITPSGGGLYSAHLKRIIPVDLDAYIPLSKILRLCILSTGLELNTRFYSNVNEVNAVGRMLETVYENGESYLKEESWSNCYDVLKTILFPLRLTLFQAEGYWNIVRWDELRYWNKKIPGLQYDKDFEFLGSDALNNSFTVGFEQATYPLSAPEKSILRPDKLVKETFNYDIPAQLRNSNLQKLGSKFNSVTVDGIRTDSYYFPASSRWQHIYGDTAYIIVKTQILLFNEIELDRYVYQPWMDNGLPFGYQRQLNVEFNHIPVNAGDVFDFECSIKTASPISEDIVRFPFSFHLLDSSGHYYQLSILGGQVDVSSDDGAANDNLSWEPFTLTPFRGITFNRNIADTDAEKYTDIKISELGKNGKVPPFPRDGFLVIRMYGTNNPGPTQPHVDAIWKNLSFSLTNYVVGSIKVVGQTHTHIQNKSPKNKEDEEIFVDDSPRTSIRGTLFTGNGSEFLRPRTILWSRNNTGVAEAKRLGEIVTYEQLYHRRVSRTKVEGTFYRLVQNDANISPLTLISHTELPGLWFTIGALTVDYRNDNARINMLEMATDTEIAGVYDEIGRNTVAIQTTSPHTLGVSTSLTVPINIGDRVTVVGSSVAGSYTVESFSTVGSFIQIIVTETIGTYSGPALVIISRRNYNENFGQTYEFKYIYK